MLSDIFPVNGKERTPVASKEPIYVRAKKTDTLDYSWTRRTTKTPKIENFPAN